MSALPLLVSYPTNAAVVRAMSRELALPSEERALALDLLGQGLPPLTRREWIPFLFGVSPKIVGAMEVRSERYYRRFSLPKRSGGRRQIVTPRRFLKTIQRWLLHRVLTALPTSDDSHGFVPGRNIFTNAEVHLGGRNLLAVDIHDFFPSVGIGRVRALLQEYLPFPESVAGQLAGLCTLDGALPQGAPTSPQLANAAFHTADLALAELAAEWGVAYSRYADDLAFSGERIFTAEDVQVVSDVVEQTGFALHGGKTRIVGTGGRQIVAGIVVNHAGLPPREVRRRWRAMFHRAGRHPREFINRAAQLSGVAAFVNQYNANLAVEYWAVAEQVSALMENTGGDG